MRPKLDAAAKTAVKNGLPYIGYSYSAASSASDLIPGAAYTELDGAIDCLTPRCLSQQDPCERELHC